MSTSTTPAGATTATVSTIPVRLGHAVLKMKDLEAAKRFYVDLLGFELANVYPRMIFFRLGGDHHTLAVLKVDENAAPPTQNQVGLYHLAFQLENFDALRAVYRKLKENGVSIRGTVTHTMSHSVYFHDPEGNEIEFYCDRYPDKDWSGQGWEGPNQPLNLDDEAPAGS